MSRSRPFKDLEKIFEDEQTYWEIWKGLNDHLNKVVEHSDIPYLVEDYEKQLQLIYRLPKRLQTKVVKMWMDIIGEQKLKVLKPRHEFIFQDYDENGKD